MPFSPGRARWARSLRTAHSFICMTLSTQTANRSLLDQIRATRTLYRAAKYVQPAYLWWLSLSSRVARSIMSSPGINQLLENPTAVGFAATMSEDDRYIGGLRAVSVQPDAQAQRTLAQSLRADQHATWSKVQHAHSGPANVYTLTDGRAWGSDGAVVTRNRVLLGDLSPVIRLRPAAHPIFRRPILKKPRRVNGRVAVATGPSPDNLSHWMFGILPRVSLITQLDPHLSRTDWIMLPPVRTTFQRECLRRFEIPSAKLIEADAMTFLEASELVTPSFASPAYVAPSWFLKDLRHRFEDVAPEGCERIYISRRAAPGRRVLNEANVESMLATRGFRSIQLERLPFAEQVALFKGARAIVSAHGAGLSLLAFARPGTAVVELFAASYLNPMYWCLADELGLRYRCCLAKSDGQKVHSDLVRDDIIVEMDELTSIVDGLITAEEPTPFEDARRTLSSS